MTDDGPQYRDAESAYKRIDRHWSELLQELRVTQAGVQILAGLLYTVPFQPGFADLDGWQRIVYLVAVSLATLAAALLIAPVAFHRAMYRRRLRPELIDVSILAAKLGLVTLALSLVAVVTLVFSVVLGPVAGFAGGAVSLLTFAFLWLALPAWLAHGTPAHDED